MLAFDTEKEKNKLSKYQIGQLHLSYWSTTKHFLSQTEKQNTSNGCTFDFWGRRGRGWKIEKKIPYSFRIKTKTSFSEQLRDKSFKESAQAKKKFQNWQKTIFCCMHSYGKKKYLACSSAKKYFCMDQAKMFLTCSTT